jgi:DNA invertase Pin-like site-specific DNA recombinase
MLVGYARVSTQDQNPQLQIDALTAANCERIFTEHVSGVSVQRPQLHAALEFVRAGDTLVVWKLDRLARSLKQLIETIEALSARQIGFRSLTELINTTTSGGKLIFHVFGALAEFERGIIRDRTVAGLEAARARGRKGGLPRLMNEQRILMAQALIADGRLTIAEIACELGVSDGTLYKHFPRPRASIVQEV